MSKQDRQVVRTAPELERKLGGQRRSSSSDFSGSDPMVEQINQALQQYMNRTNAEIKNLKDNMGYLTPQIDITDIEGGHRITITDKDGTESFDVMDGTGGTTGTAADSEKLGGQLPEYYAKASDIPSLEGYAKTSEIPSLDGYAKTSDIPSLEGYAKTSDIPSLEGYAKTSDIPTVPSKVSAFENDKGYLTEHQDLSGYAKTSDIPSKISAFENDKGYLTQHQDLSSYAKKSEIPTIPSSLPANGGNADTVDGYHIRKVTDASDTGQTGYITFIV